MASPTLGALAIAQSYPFAATGTGTQVSNAISVNTMVNPNLVVRRTANLPHFVVMATSTQERNATWERQTTAHTTAVAPQIANSAHFAETE